MAFNCNAFLWGAFKIRPNQDKDAPMSITDSPYQVTDQQGHAVTLFADGGALCVICNAFVRVHENQSTKSQGLSS